MTATRVDMVVVGAGFAGLRTLHTMREQGLSVVVLEAGDGIGGTWYFNRYPGARCDVESADYSYSFSPELEQEWRWSERYASQSEILAYINYVADRFDLWPGIRLNTRCSRAEFDEERERWSVTAESGETWDAQFVVLATGPLSATKMPEIEGRDDFAGELVHTAQWPSDGVDFTGKRVGVIGTGSSGTQLIPIVAREAEHLTVFQRTPNFSVPARNAPISDEQDAQIKANYPERRKKAHASPNGLGIIPGKESALDFTPEEREAHYESQWGRIGFGFVLSYPDLLTDERANETASDFLRRKIAAAVDDPETAETLTPRDYPFGAKRPCVDSEYFETFNRSTVDLVDVRRTPIEKITPAGVTTTEGEYPLDVLVFATGFDAMSGSMLRQEIVGRGGQTLREKWSAGPVSYLGLGIEGFPNLFVTVGPGSPSLLSNVLHSIEQHVDWLAGLIAHVREHKLSTVEATPEAEQRWVQHVNETAEATLYPKARSYYLGDNVPGKPRVFMPYAGGTRRYRRICEKVAENGYEGFAMSGGKR